MSKNTNQNKENFFILFSSIIFMNEKSVAGQRTLHKGPKHDPHLQWSAV